jgi:hypothetical protein
MLTLDPGDKSTVSVVVRSRIGTQVIECPLPATEDQEVVFVEVDGNTEWKLCNQLVHVRINGDGVGRVRELELARRVPPIDMVLPLDGEKWYSKEIDPRFSMRKAPWATAYWVEFKIMSETASVARSRYAFECIDASVGSDVVSYVPRPSDLVLSEPPGFQVSDVGMVYTRLAAPVGMRGIQLKWRAAATIGSGVVIGRSNWRDLEIEFRR